MKYLLDTNICIYIIKIKPEQVLKKFASLSLSDVGISSITVAELEYGVYKSQQKEQNQTALNQFLIPLEIVPYDEKAAKVYAEVRGELERKGMVIGAMDMLIASQAISLEVTLVTNNVNEFSRIPNLVLENWV
ncbi:type II toxin-antitoxin system tRNA(fMet)-specific endonuclease VapC [Capilliphycus salinus ALCB114379]|uniref:type II toxin-antitoxin system tRNA(fMet)-specific endonuclease VapC n=1 Tax=Capilliphycus salinus TaxID=2768948 RepID=UPI0039A66D82